MDFKRDFRLNRAQTLHYLASLCETAGHKARTLYGPPGLTVDAVQSHVFAALGLACPPGLAAMAQSSPTGFCLLSGTAVSLILPPFPVRDLTVFGSCAPDALHVMLQHDKVIAIVLVRLGSYAVGVARGDRLVASKVGTGLVHSRHRQGGSSARRFERRRDKQTEQFLARVCARVDEYIGSQADAVDFMAYGGARTTIALLKKRCPVLARFEDRELPPLLDIADPRQPVLEAAVRRVWSSRILEWHPADGLAAV